MFVLPDNNSGKIQIPWRLGSTWHASNSSPYICSFFSIFFIVDLRVGVYSFLIIDSNFFTELHWASEYFLVNISAPLPHSWFIVIVYEFSCENMWSMLNLRKMKIKNETEEKKTATTKSNFQKINGCYFLLDLWCFI